MRIFKKVISAFLASVMCIPSGMLNLAYAAESDGGGSYTVALAEPENGTMQFSEACMEASTASQDSYHMVRIGDDGEAVQVENDGSLWAFSEGDTVEVELIPDEGYEVSSLSLKNADTGNEMAHEDTSDNVFSFVMPAKNVTVNAVFGEMQENDSGNDGQGNSAEEDNPAENGSDENNIITENEYGETVYGRTELTDDISISLQERIDSLPDMEDLLYSLYMEDESISEITDEINDIGDIYFNRMTDKERAQVRPAALFADMLILEAEVSEFMPESDEEPSGEELETLQERIDSLRSIYEIVEPEMTDEGAKFAFDGGNMYIPNGEQDELFLEVLNLSKKIFFLKPEYKEKLDMAALEELYRFFRSEHTVSFDNGMSIMSAEENGITTFSSFGGSAVDPLMSGHYERSSANNDYKSSFYSGAVDNDARKIILYCGDAGKPAFTHAAASVNFSDGGHVEEIKKSPTNDDGHNLIRSILYYGFRDPGYEGGMGLADPANGIEDSAYPGPLVDPLVTSAGDSIVGVEVHHYMITHFALSSAYSHSDGRGPTTVGQAPGRLVDFATANIATVPDNFRVFVIVPDGRWQPLFYFVLDEIGKPIRNPFNLYLFKVSNQQGYETKTATLAGAEFSVRYYAAEFKPDGTVDNASLIKSHHMATSSNAIPTATFTFETKLLIPNHNNPIPGSKNFRDQAVKLQDAGFSPIAGVEFGPINIDGNEGIIDDESNGENRTIWRNQFLTSSADEYNQYWGGPGTYLIYESRSPQGYDLSGIMSIGLDEDGDYSYDTTNLQHGLAFTLTFNNDEGTPGTYYYVNGYQLQAHGAVKIRLPDPVTGWMKDVQFGNPDKGKEDALQGGGVVVVRDKPQIPKLWTEAVSIDTGTQWADPKSSNIYLQDSVHVEMIPERAAKYYVDTRLYDLSDGKFLSFGSDTENAHSFGGTVLEQLRIPDGFGSVFNGGDVPNGIVTNVYSSKENVEPGETYDFKVKCKINGDGLEGHTLVFVNVVTVLNGYDGNIPIGGGSFGKDGPVSPEDYRAVLVYQYPTSRTAEESIVKDAAGSVISSMNEFEWMKQDSLEMIYLTQSSTNIISDQTQRKKIENGENDLRNESIIYAGMYLDDSFTSGGGAIKQSLTDTIHYENLQPNRTYYVKGHLVNRDTGEPAVDANGTPIQNTENTVKQQSSSTGSGDWKIKYSFDATGCGNRVYVSYVEVYLADELVLEYKNKDDAFEAFYIPEITTRMWDHSTGTDISYADETVTVHDTITYKKFLPGKKYKVESRLVNMETGETLLDVNGRPVTASAVKTISREDGTITVDLTFPAVIRDEKGDIVKSLAGTIFVCYEKIYIEQGHEGSGKWVLIADHEDFWDKDQRIYMPYIDTTALDQKTREHISYAEKDMKIYDTVHYEALRPEYTYRLVSELRDAATGEVVTDNAGKAQVLTTYFKADFDLQDNQYLTYGDVIPENHDGSGITFDVDAEFFAGRTLVVYERLYIENDYGTGSHLVAEHQALLDEDQTIHVPKVWTSAIDSDTFTKTSFADGSTTIIDTFSYENLIPGFTYELKGYVLDKNQSITTGTNVTVSGTDGKPARNSVVFTPESSSGAVRLSFEVDTGKFGTEDYNGMVFVVYEELYVIQRYNGGDTRSIVASHTDIADLNQTIYVPRVTTELTDRKTGTKIADADGTMQLTDTVSYYRFQPNTEYVVKGKLLDMQTGNVLADGRGSRVEKTVTVMSSDTGTGEWQIDYSFDGTSLAGKIIVAYADVYVRNGERNGILSHVAGHNDFWDESQRVYIPLISTVATDRKTNSHITYAEENVWVADRISYSFLKPDTEYRLISKLVDKDMGEVVVDDKGMEQVITSDFVTTPNESQEKYNQIISNPLTDSSDTGIGYSYGYIIPADGTALPDGTPYRGVVFTFDAHTFEGRTLVIYEELQIRTADNRYMTVARHTDINDENQTVHIPKIRTNAVDSETLTHSSKMDGSMTVIDTVKYENLIPGFTYVLEGFLMDKPRDDTKGYGKIKDKDGSYITNRMEFTPDRPSGEVKLLLGGNASEFQTDEGAFSSETLVVFEWLYLKDNRDASDELLIVASHEDINDENQTIYCPRISTKVVAYDLGEESKDGDADHVIGYTAYECGYCKTRFQTEKEVRTHIDSNVKCKNMGAKARSVTEATIYDRVYCENLIPDRTYGMVGHLIDTKTGKAVLINQRAVRSEEKYFTPGTPGGAGTEMHRTVQGLPFIKRLAEK